MIVKGEKAVQVIAEETANVYWPDGVGEDEQWEANFQLDNLCEFVRKVTADLFIEQERSAINAVTTLAEIDKLLDQAGFKDDCSIRNFLSIAISQVKEVVGK